MVLCPDIRDIANTSLISSKREVIHKTRHTYTNIEWTKLLLNRNITVSTTDNRYQLLFMSLQYGSIE